MACAFRQPEWKLNIAHLAIWRSHNCNAERAALLSLTEPVLISVIANN